MNKTTLLMLASSAILLAGCSSTTTQTGNVPEPTAAPVATTTTTTTDAKMAANIKAFTVTGSNVTFDVKEIKVKKGDTVKITFKNAEGMHDWKVDEFNAATKVIKAGEEETIEFYADKAGSFEYYCSVGQHRKLGMKGMLIVE